MSGTASTGASEATQEGADISDTDDATVRDRVWNATLALIAQRPLPFQLWRVRKRAALGREHDRTIRRTLSVMADAGWLDHEHNSAWWYPGEKAKRQFDAEYPF